MSHPTPSRASAALLGAALVLASPAALHAQFTNWTLNGTASRISTDLQLTPDNAGRVGSAWAPTLLPTGSWTTSFRFVANSTGNNNGGFFFGDGVAFVLQNNAQGRNALRVACCAGMNGVSPLVGHYITGTGAAGITTSGNPGDPANSNVTFNVGTTSPGDRIWDAMIAYDAVARSLTFSGVYTFPGVTTGTTWTVGRTGVDFVALLGTATPYFGFTGSTANNSADQRIRNFTFTGAGGGGGMTGVPEPSTWAMLGGGLVALGAVARRRARA